MKCTYYIRRYQLIGFKIKKVDSDPKSTNKLFKKKKNGNSNSFLKRWKTKIFTKKITTLYTTFDIENL